MTVAAAGALSTPGEAVEAVDLGSRGITLVLTATLGSRAAGPGPGRPGPLGRLRDYGDALRFYLGMVGDAVEALVFADDSGSDLEPLRQVAEQVAPADRVEFLSAPASEPGREFGHAYEEFRLLDEVMARSRLVGRLSPTDKVWKVTGRYRIVNLPQLVARAPRDFDVYCNARNWPTRALDLGLIAWSVAGYEVAFRGLYRELREDLLPHAAEVEMRAVLDRLEGRLRIVRRYTAEPRIAGVRSARPGPVPRRVPAPVVRVGRPARPVTLPLWN